MWRSYLESICREYAQWWEVYTLTDVAGKKPLEQRQNISPLLDLGLMVQTVAEEKQRERPEEKIERLTVLEGLRKYAPNHVLLVGRPGSGKSTALARLLLEEAEKLRSPLSLSLEEESPLSPPLGRGETRETPPLGRGEIRETLSFTRKTVGETRATPPLQRGVGGDKTCNTLANTIKIFHHFIVCKTNYLQTITFQYLSSMAIVSYSFFSKMSFSIYFDR